MLICGNNSFGVQWCGYIFILCYTHLKLALLLHKQDLVATGVGTTVSEILRVKTFLGTQCSSPYSISRHMAERWLQKNKRQIERLRAKCAVWQCVKSESFSVEISCCCCLAFLFQISFHWKISVSPLVAWGKMK